MQNEEECGQDSALEWLIYLGERTRALVVGIPNTIVLTFVPQPTVLNMSRLSLKEEPRMTDVAVLLWTNR